MRLIHSLRSLAALNERCVATVGAFDALHLGHRSVIQETRSVAKQRKLPSAVVMFEPLPGEFFSTEDAQPRRIYPLRKRIELVRDQGIDYLLCLSFTESLANWSAHEFIKNIVVDGLGAHYIVVGDDFRFGRNRQGDCNLLYDYGKRYGFEIGCIREVTVKNVRASSTRIRRLLLNGDIAEANQMLGSPYVVSGRVRRGERLGTRIGYPTANLSFTRRPPPLQGVFAVAVEVQGVELTGVCNAGVRPTVDGEQYRMETHIFDFSKEIYGERIAIYPLHYLRPEQQFSDIDQLRGAISKDIKVAKLFIENEGGIADGCKR